MDALTIIALLSYLAAVVLLGLTFFPFSPMTLKLWMPSRDTMVFAHRNRYMLRASGGLGLAASFVLGMSGLAAGGWAWAAAATSVFFAFFWWGGYVPVIMGCPRAQKVLNAQEADALLKADDDVVGVIANGEVRAYSRTAITRPHLYYDRLGGTPVTVTYCILCNSAMVFKSELHGHELHLQPITAFNNNILYYDAASENYIQQIEGKVIAGPDAGAQLAALPAMLTTWQAWKALHPQTTVLHVAEGGLRDRMLSWMLSWMIPLPRLARGKKPWHPLKGALDTRLPAMALVFGVEIRGERKAYPVSVLRSGGVVNDTVGGVPIVVLYDPELDTGGIFTRHVDGQVLSFEAYPERRDGIVTVDAETASQWDAMGTARAGTLAGTELVPVPHFGKVFWFSWSGFRPGTELGVSAAEPIQRAS